MRKFSKTLLIPIMTGLLACSAFAGEERTSIQPEEVSILSEAEKASMQRENRQMSATADAALTMNIEGSSVETSFLIFGNGENDKNRVNMDISGQVSMLGESSYFSIRLYGEKKEDGSIEYYATTDGETWNKGSLSEFGSMMESVEDISIFELLSACGISFNMVSETEDAMFFAAQIGKEEIENMAMFATEMADEEGQEIPEEVSIAAQAIRADLIITVGKESNLIQCVQIDFSGSDLKSLLSMTGDASGMDEMDVELGRANLIFNFAYDDIPVPELHIPDDALVSEFTPAEAISSAFGEETEFGTEDIDW